MAIAVMIKYSADGYLRYQILVYYRPRRRQLKNRKILRAPHGSRAKWRKPMMLTQGVSRRFILQTTDAKDDLRSLDRNKEAGRNSL